MLHHAQRLAVFIDIQRHTIAGKVDFFESFGNAHERHFTTNAHFIEGFDRRAQLTFATIHHHKLRQLLTLLHQASVATREHLLHRGEIVGAFHGADIEVAIIFFRRFGILEHHARSHRIGALNIGVIETLHMSRQLIKAEIALHGHQCARNALLGI